MDDENTERFFLAIPASELVRERERVPDDARVRATLAALAFASPAAASPADAHPLAALRARIVASARVGGRYGVFADRIARLFDLSSDDARDYLARIERPDAWGPGPMQGVAILPVTAGPRCADAIATFTRFDPGVVFPLHEHIGAEVTIVVEGGFRDATGVEIWRGDELYKAPTSRHDFAVVGDGICIAAAVAFGGIDLL